MTPLALAGHSPVETLETVLSRWPTLYRLMPVRPWRWRPAARLAMGNATPEFDRWLAGPTARGGFFQAAAPAPPVPGLLHREPGESHRPAMLHSLMIPFEAYDANWRRLFRQVYDDGGLVEVLNRNGWHTALAIPLVETPVDLRELPWWTRLGPGGSSDSLISAHAPVVLREPGGPDHSVVHRLRRKDAAALRGPGDEVSRGNKRYILTGQMMCLTVPSTTYRAICQRPSAARLRGGIFTEGNHGQGPGRRLGP